MADFLQKEADLEFRRGLEELVRGHLDGCITAAALSSSCSSAAGGGLAGDGEIAVGDAPGGGGGEGGLDRRRRRAELGGDDEDEDLAAAESSAAARRHSRRILSRWVARQAEEMMITATIERRNRENELMALAGLHTVSMLDSSFLRESGHSPSASPVERRAPAARPPSILQMWRELEDRRSNAGDRSQGERRELRGASEVSSESEYNSYASWSHGPLASPGRGMEEDEEDRGSSREQSPDLGDGERERVRQIVRGWMTESGMAADAESRVSPGNENPRAEWLGEVERERVRLVREWVQMSSQQRDARSSRREDREGSVTDHEDGQPEHVRRDLLRIRGRQARLELIMRMVRERERELQSLSEHRAVSDFAHRNRIQSLLRGRFLRNERPTEERPPSVAARELGQLRQRHPVTGIREGFRFRLENIVRGQAVSHSDALASQNVNGPTNDQSSTMVELPNDNHEQFQSRNENVDMHQAAEPAETHTAVEMESSSPDENVDMQDAVTPVETWQEEDAERERRDWQQSTESGFSDWHEETGEESDGNWHENIEQDWSRDSPDDEDGEENPLPEVHEEWHEDESQDTTESWHAEHPDPPTNQRSFLIGRSNTFIPSDDDNVYSSELRELLSRRSVSNLLHSGFRESLDQLIQSYVQRQGHAPLDFDLPTSASPEEDQDQQQEDPAQDVQESDTTPPLLLPPPPLPPRQPLWHSELHHNNWTRQNLHRSEIEWDIINDLRADMGRLQQGMNHMQRMLEACMEMQLELQRSVKQEVSAALNRAAGGQGTSEELSNDGSKWSQVRKGTCCICCDSHIDSLLYRCGHMCTCSKCANELVRGGGKCPLCRAPIVEVIRAYSIL